MSQNSPVFTKRDSKELGLCDIPAEIRLRCYRYAFRNDKPLMPTRKRVYLHGQKLLKRDCPAFQMRISKAFAFEAGAVVYGENDYSFPDFCSGLIFLKQIGMGNCRFLQTLAFRDYRGTGAMLPAEVHDEMVAVIADILSCKCPSLKSLAISDVAPPKDNDNWAMKTLEEFRDTIETTKTLGMTKVYYSRSERSLLLTRPHIVEPSGGKKYQPFDIDLEIQTLKDETHANRVAGSQKAILTKKAKRAAT